MIRRVLLCLLFLASAEATQAQAPCSSEGAHQFDFWVGEWSNQLRTRDFGTDQWNQSTGSTQVTKEHGGCVIRERSFDQGGDLAGESVSVFNKHAGKWQHTWIDKWGLFLPYVGQFEDDKMTLTIEPQMSTGEFRSPMLERGGLRRMIFEEINPDAFLWRYEHSADGGESWQSIVESEYSRVK